MQERANDATAVTESETADRTLVIERVFRAPPDKVFRAWTDPEILVRWWGPEGMHIPDCEMDVRPGGAWRTTMANKDGDTYTVAGEYREIAAPNRLVMTWGWIQDDGRRGHETEVVVTFEDVPHGTRMRLVQSVFQDAEQRNSHEMGWQSTLNDLEKVLG